MKKKRNIVHCTPAQFVDVLRNLDSPQFAAGIFDTPVDFNKYADYYLEVDGKKKKNPNAILNPFFDDGVRCVTKKFKLVTGFDYETSIVTEAKKEGVPLTWERGDIWYNLISKTLAVHKNDPTKFYFRYQYLDNSIITADYYFKGNTIDRTIFKQFLKDKSKAYANQGLYDPTAVQVVSVDNIVECSINGTTYILQHANPQPYWEQYIEKTIDQDTNE
jgi:hypothetical protein